MAKSTKTVKPPATAKSGDYIEHEEVNKALVQAPPPSPVEVVAEETAEEMAGLQLKKFNINDAKIAELQASYGGLTITGQADLTGLEKVKKGFNEVRSLRTSFEKQGADIRRKFNFINKLISAEEDRLIDLVRPLELELGQQLTDYKAEENRLETERKQREEDEFNRRLDELVSLGMTLDEGYYSLASAITVDAATLRAMSVDKYGQLLKTVGAKKAELDAAQALEDQKEAARQAQLDAQQAQIDEQNRRLQEQEDQLASKQEELDKQVRDAREARNKLRTAQLQAEGFVFQIDRFKYEDGLHAPEVLMAAAEFEKSDFEFAIALSVATDRVRELKRLYAENEETKKAAAAKLEKRKSVVAEAMQRGGLTYRYKSEDFLFQNDVLGLTYRMADLVQLTDEELGVLETKVITDIGDAKRRQAENEQRELERKEQARLDGLNDFQLLQDYLAKLNAVKVPTGFTTNDFRTKALQFHKALTDLIDQYNRVPDDAN